MYELAKAIYNFIAIYDNSGDCLDLQCTEIVSQLRDTTERSGMMYYFHNIIETTMDDTVAEEAASLYRAMREI